MGRQEMSTTLPEVLVERILAMVPFPNIFKARVLSKSWLARLSPVSSQAGDEEKKPLAVAFQKMVSEYSSKWTTFCPVFVGNEGLLAYEEASQRWRSIPTLSFLPSNHLLKSTWSTQQIRGALSLIIGDLCGELFVANVLTGSCKRLLPFAPEHDDSVVSSTVVSDKETYSVIQLRECLNYYLAEIYDSQLDSWRSTRLDVSEDFQIYESYGGINPEFQNGVLYWVGGGITMTFCLVALNVREGTFKLLQMASPNIQPDSHSIDLVVCNGSLLMVFYHVYDDGHVTLMKADLGSRRWLKVSEGPPSVLEFGPLAAPISNGNCIYFLGEHLNKVLAYNVRKDEWSSFLIPEILRRGYNHHGEEYQLDVQPGLNPGKEYQFDAVCFQPGLNPFVAV